MTTTVKVHVNGNYRTTVRQEVDGVGRDPVLVNHGEEKVLYFDHGKSNTFTITEEYLGDKPAAA